MFIFVVRLFGQERLKRLLSLREINQLLPRSGAASNSLERPLFILLDREVDFNVMFHHTWSYQALVHDLFELRSVFVKLFFS